MARSTGPAQREMFSSRNVFILAAVGSAVGLGNIWRFPYTAYENGGGAFIIPYLVALFSAGIPLLLFDYAIGHRYRGSAPLSFRRIGGKGAEVIGWWQVLVCVVIGLYYAVIVGWSLMYTIFSVNFAWGDDPSTYFFGDFLNLADTPGFGMEFVPQTLIPHVLVWVVVFVIIALGVKRGIAAANLVFMPLLLVMFLILVVQSVMLPGAFEGLNTLFTPNWQVLTDPEVWSAAYGQIFFSLSIGFGIMITYASYLKRKTDLTGSGMVVAFSNSGFELLAGIGVFSALGFIAQAQGVAVGEVAKGGIGLAFVAFPTIISEAPAGQLIGVLFFGSLVFAGLTSLISIIEVVVAGVREKLGWNRLKGTMIVVIPMAIISTLIFPTRTGMYVLDIVDEFVNQFGILAGGLAAVILVAFVLRKVPRLSDHLSRISSIPAGGWWRIMIMVVVPIVLAILLVLKLAERIQNPYGDGDYDAGMLGVFGWGMAALLPLLAIGIAMLPWSRKIVTDVDETQLDEAFAASTSEELEIITRDMPEEAAL